MLRQNGTATPVRAGLKLLRIIKTISKPPAGQGVCVDLDVLTGMVAAHCGFDSEDGRLALTTESDRPCRR